MTSSLTYWPVLISSRTDLCITSAGIWYIKIPKCSLSVLNINSTKRVSVKKACKIGLKMLTSIGVSLLQNFTPPPPPPSQCSDRLFHATLPRTMFHIQTIWQLLDANWWLTSVYTGYICVPFPRITKCVKRETYNNRHFYVKLAQGFSDAELNIWSHSPTSLEKFWRT
jgi:hypothetical protein